MASRVSSATQSLFQLSSVLSDDSSLAWRTHFHFFTLAFSALASYLQLTVNTKLGLFVACTESAACHKEASRTAVTEDNPTLCQSVLEDSGGVGGYYVWHSHLCSFRECFIQAGDATCTTTSFYLSLLPLPLRSLRVRASATPSRRQACSTYSVSERDPIPLTSWSKRRYRSTKRSNSTCSTTATHAT